MYKRINLLNETSNMRSFVGLLSYYTFYEFVVLYRLSAAAFGGWDVPMMDRSYRGMVRS
ncbi:hypothetical protein HanRHA438_Chr17g0813471 [Helianthus annuus]|nr:hypothetical protein HanIR_Chr17g0871461 [Helianthus annuus]KAJ0826363.1 hypothetical protein HanRHA438_Chr17g0813471 [Helianthus annuus]